MVSTRGCNTREVFFSVGDSYMSWFPAPDESPVSDQVHTGDGSTQLLNGFADIQGSYYGHKKYELTWSFLNHKQADLFRRLFMNRTGEWVTYADPFAMNNILSPLMSLPYLHYYASSPFAFNDWGKQALFPTSDLDAQSGHKGVILKPDILTMNNKFGRLTGNELNSRQVSLALSKPGNYTERVAIPEGYVGEFYIKGHEDGKLPFNWRFTSKDGGGNLIVVTADVKNRVAVINSGIWEIEMSPWTEGHLAWCALRVTAVEERNQFKFISNPPEYYFSYPSGGGNLQVVPGTARVVTVNNKRGHFTASVTLEEVWSW